MYINRGSPKMRFAIKNYWAARYLTGGEMIIHNENAIFISIWPAALFRVKFTQRPPPLHYANNQ